MTIHGLNKRPKHTLSIIHVTAILVWKVCLVVYCGIDDRAILEDHLVTGDQVQ